MSLKQRLDIKQGQALVMTPQLQQAIKLLQLSNLELSEFVEAELERNPLLERLEPEPADPQDLPDRSDRAELRLSDERPPAEADHGLDAAAADMNPDMCAHDLADAGAAPLTDWSKVQSGKSFDDLPDFEDSLSEAVTLGEHLDRQATAAGFTPTERLIAGALIDGVDEWGYWRGNPADLAAQLGCAPALVERVLSRMKGFEPTGIMARDLAECLSLQLLERDRFDPAMAALIGNLDLLAKSKLDQLCDICGVDREDLQDMIAEVRALSPKPGAAFGGGVAQTVVPDVFVRPGPDGGWHVELNAETLPKVLMNQRYYAQVAKSARKEADKLFLSDCAASASWLVKSLDQRAKTILRVAREIVRQQDGFFAFGVQHLRPLNLKTVAQAIDMHESTVSRVTANNSVSTPRGVFALTYFFTAAIQAADGGAAHSAESVRDQIKKLIQGEKPDNILSDDRIVDILREAGVDIARRTVAKYRESLRIPSSVERKRRLAASR